LEESGRSALQAPTLPALEVLFEDAALVALNKPAGVVTQPTPSGRGSSLLDAATARWGTSVGLVHRLDRETSGVVLFGRTPAATRSLAAAFRERQVQKQYLAVVGPGAPPEGTIDLPISKDPKRPGRYRASRTAHGLTAITRFRRLGGGQTFTALELFPETGRTHQLRAHLTALGWPIFGDALYGGPGSAGGFTVARCLLHAFTLCLAHPVSRKQARFEAPPPPDFAPFLSKL
jgi:23S rRNA pseudouridine1911/1915/1917 synthase